jgi:hypothetical protein
MAATKFAVYQIIGNALFYKNSTINTALFSLVKPLAATRKSL